MNAAEDNDALVSILAAATQALGFERFAIGHHVDIRRRPYDAISLTSYPDEWVGEATAKGYHIDDPILIASTRTAVGFKWSDVRNIMTLTDRQERILERGKEFGLSEGYTVPVHIPGEYWGTCSFGASSLELVDDCSLRAAQLLGVFGFEAARRLVRQSLPDGGNEHIPLLTPRQVDCVTLIAQGKTDWEAAQVLGLSRETVHQHIETARQRYGVTKRTQLVVRAIYDGQIPFSSVIN